jgi:hypothetical protein
MKRLILSHCVASKCFTQILCTLITDLISVEVEFGECLYEMRKMNMIKMKRLILSHCVFSQPFTQILCTLITDLIAVEIEFGECLYEMRTMNLIEMKRLILSHWVLSCVYHRIILLLSTSWQKCVFLFHIAQRRFSIGTTTKINQAWYLIKTMQARFNDFNIKTITAFITQFRLKKSSHLQNKFWTRESIHSYLEHVRIDKIFHNG